jgi:hypothetical protein
MYNFLQTFHSHFRWIIFLAAIIAIVLPIINANQTVNKKSKLPALVFMIVTDVQFLMGILLYFVYSSMGLSAFENGMAFVMKNADVRKIAVEHFTLMIIAWAMVHIGYVKIKKAQTGKQVQKTSLVFFGIALVLILAAIPWARL